MQRRHAQDPLGPPLPESIPSSATSSHQCHGQRFHRGRNTTLQLPKPPTFQSTAAQPGRPAPDPFPLRTRFLYEATKRRKADDTHNLTKTQHQVRLRRQQGPLFIHGALHPSKSRLIHKHIVEHIEILSTGLKFLSSNSVPVVQGIPLNPFPLQSRE